MLKEEQLSRYYISFSTINKKILELSKLKLKYDYKDEKVLKSIEKLSNFNISEKIQFSERETKMPFYEALSLILLDIDNEKVYDFFGLTANIANIKRIDGLNIFDSQAKIIKDGDKIDFKISIPERKVDTDVIHASVIHELSHFSLLLGKDRRDIFEYSEALSMFFEYMMYTTINNDDSKSFINNRLSMLRQTLEDIKDDIYYALNPHFLSIDRSHYAIPLAYNLAYPESFEYVLQLINRRKQDKEVVDNLIGDMLLGNIGIEEARSKLDINTDNYEEINKLIKKKC